MRGILDMALAATPVAADATVVTIVVFVVVFAAVSTAGFFWLSRTERRSRSIGQSDRADLALLNGEPLPRSERAVPEDAATEARSQRGSRIDPRHVLGVAHKGLSLLIVGVLVALTIGSYLAANPHDGSLLLPAVLAMVTLITGLHLHNRARRYAPVDRELQADLLRNVEIDFASKLQEAMRGNVEIRWDSSPEVHRIDEEALARARAMEAEGRPIEEICRSMEPDYEGWSASHQQAYQGLIRAALEHR